MGHLPRRDLLTAYNRIKRDAAGRTCSVLILVSPTVDALCALKILTVPSPTAQRLTALGATQV